MLPTKELFNSEMKSWHYNSYQVEFKDKFLPFGIVTFEANSKGEPIGFKIDLPNPDFHFYKMDFKKVE
jgi:hypothetical protein